MKVVRFTHNHVPYNGGEFAGFADEQADELIAAGHAEEVLDPMAEVEHVPVAPPQFEVPAPAVRRRAGNATLPAAGAGRRNG